MEIYAQFWDGKRRDARSGDCGRESAVRREEGVSLQRLWQRRQAKQLDTWRSQQFILVQGAG